MKRSCLPVAFVKTRNPSGLPANRYGVAVRAENGNGVESMPTTFGTLVVGVPAQPVLTSVAGQNGGISLELAGPVYDPGFPFASTQYFANVSGCA